MICDVHAHYIPKAFSDFMGDRFSPRVGVPERLGIAKHPVSDSAADIQGPVGTDGRCRRRDADPVAASPTLPARRSRRACRRCIC